MPRVHGQLSLVTEVPERITEAHVRAPETRALGSGVVTGSPDRVRVEGGVFDAVLAPGPCVVTLVSLGVPVQHLRLIVPEGDVSLRAAFEAGLAADAGDRSVLERLAGEAAGALEAAEAANRAAGEAAEAAAGSASEAEQSASSAASSAGAADSHAKRAGAHANQAGAHASAASESAKSASASAGAAAGDADRAKQEADRAASQATAATESAGEAKGHADRAEGVVDSVQWSGDRLTVAGKTSPSLRGPRGQKGEQGDSGASTWDAITGKPDLATRNDLINQGLDYRNALQEKADKDHKHRVADITDLPTVSYLKNGQTIPRRLVGGQIRVADPTDRDHAATKGYSDTKDIEVLSEARAYTESRPAFFSGRGKPPRTIPGAVVGDYYLDETSMELHRITGV